MKNVLIVFLLAASVVGCGRRVGPPVTQDDVAAIAPVTLAPDDMRIEWKKPAAPDRVAPYAAFHLVLEIRNAGNQTWPATDSGPPYMGGKYAVRLSHRWCEEGGKVCPEFTARHELPASLEPGASQTLTILITAPEKPGSYVLQFDAVQEIVNWFSNAGAERLSIPIRVE